MNISNYLSKIQTIISPETKVRNLVTQAVSELLGISLERLKITLSRDVVTLHVSSVIKQEIILKQAKILARIRELDSSVNIKKIQ